MKESEIQKQILDWLKLQSGGFFFRTNNIGVPLHGESGGYRPSPVKGLADIIGVFKGHFIAIEVKTRKGKLTANQIEFLNNVIGGGGHAIVARSLETVIDYITHIDKVELKKDDRQLEF